MRQEFLKKPFDPAELLRRLRSMLGMAEKKVGPDDPLSEWEVKAPNGIIGQY